MFKIILVMFSGVAVGYLLRNAIGTERISTSTTVTIILLLFLMGCEIGSDDNVMRNLSSLGGEALAIAGAAVAGSIVAARAAYSVIGRQRGGDDER